MAGALPSSGMRVAESGPAAHQGWPRSSHCHLALLTSTLVPSSLLLIVIFLLFKDLLFLNIPTVTTEAKPSLFQLYSR